MSELSWQSAVDKIRPYVVRISTPEHSGTGFLFTFAAEGGICGFATAAHALRQAQQWDEPIRVEQLSTGTSRMLRAADRTIVIDPDTDTAAVVFLREELELPGHLLQRTPDSTTYRVGVEIGWLGYPSMAHDDLCFFSGRISAWRESSKSYLVDGVAVNGVSGGPAFHIDGQGEPVLLGVVSAYLPNKAVGGALPGLAVVQHIGRLDTWVQSLHASEQRG
jgi:Trypsin-like peptidase domain